MNSVRNQKYSNWEHIIIDDCSTDKSIPLIEGFYKDDNRINIIKLEKNSGAGVARNIGIEKAKGRFIAFLDADDYWHEEKLAKQIKFMLNNNIALSYSAYFEFDNKDGKIKTLVECPERVNYKSLLMNGGFMGCLTVIYDTKVFGKRYMPEIRKRQDWALWLNMLSKIDYAYGITEPLAFYRIGNQSLSKSKFQLVKHNFRVYRDQLNMSYLQSSFRMIVFLLYHIFLKRKWKTAVRSDINNSTKKL